MRSGRSPDLSAPSMTSFPRKRESIFAMPSRHWIPAFAGMTSAGNVGAAADLQEKRAIAKMRDGIVRIRVSSESPSRATARFAPALRDAANRRTAAGVCLSCQ